MRIPKSNRQCYYQKKEKIQAIVDKIVYGKLQIEQQCIAINGESSCAQKWQVVDVPPVD
jgi:hypothetical protein